MGASDILILLGAASGVAMAYEYGRRRVEYEDSTRLVLLAGLVVTVAGMADSLRGFAYLLLMPIGAYKVARVLVSPLLVPMGEARRARAARREEALDQARFVRRDE